MGAKISRGQFSALPWPWGKATILHPSLPAVPPLSHPWEVSLCLGVTYLASSARATMPAASGAEAEVPVCLSVQRWCRSVVTWRGHGGSQNRFQKSCLELRTFSKFSFCVPLSFWTELKEDQDQPRSVSAPELLPWHSQSAPCWWSCCCRWW